LTVADSSGWEPDEWGGRSIADVLADEHERLETLLADAVTTAEAVSAGAEEKARGRDVADTFVASLTRHLSSEEQELYPAGRAALPNGDRVIDTEIEADREILRTLAVVHSADPEDPSFPAALRRAQLQLRQHIETAHEQIHPEVRRQLSREEQIRLGNRVDIVQEAAPTRPHPDTPSTPPLNKVVDPALGTVDKVRDILAGRKTRPQDL
jgi:hemerythrin-like domain-containing protein